MALKPTPIKISDSVLRILSKFSQSRTLPIRQVERAKVFFLCSQGWNNLQISYQVYIHQNAVSKWLNRFFKSLPLLQQVEQTDPEHPETQISALLAAAPAQGSLQRLPMNRSSKSLKSPAATRKNTALNPVIGALTSLRMRL